MAQLMQWIRNKISEWRERDFSYEIIGSTADPFELQVKLTDGKFKGKIFSITNVIINDDGSASCVIQKHNFAKVMFIPTHYRLEEVIQTVFTKILQTSKDNYTQLRKEILNDDEDREDYFEEPVVERAVCKRKSVSKSKKRVRTRQVRKAFAGRDKKLHRKVQPSTKSRSNTSSTPK